jgi:hypothetical protein
MPRKSKAKPFYTIDCETDPFKVGRVPQPFIWGLYDGANEVYEEFDTASDIVAYLRDRDVVVYAHNGGKFDYHYLRDHINSDDAIMVIAGRLARFKIGEAEFRDSMNLLVNPLRAFAKEEIDYTKLEEEVRAQHLEEIKKYLRSDCVNLWVTIQAYFDRFGRSMTQAGASMRYWKKHYPVEFVPQSAAQAMMYRQFYYGGRVQCFEQGFKETPFDVVDINSAYPYAMLSNHPISRIGEISSHLPPEGKLERCMIKLEGTAQGCFPYRTESNELYFPDDNVIREYCVTGWELVAALKLDACKIFRVKECHYFSQTVNFRDYILHFYEERLKAKANNDKMGDVFAKLFMNSLYGKFASDPEKYREYLIASDESYGEHAAKGYQIIKPWGERHLCARPLSEDKHKYYNVATAASITGYVRAHLFTALRQCEGLLYCDTDSIAARDTSRLSMGNELGRFKHEMSCDQYAIAGKKLYAFRERGSEKEPKYKTASKGVKLDAADIIRVARGETITYEPMVPTYSIRRDEPTFTNRAVKMTAKDIRTLATV